MADVFLLIVGWLHAIAAVAWVGGGIFYWLVLRPAMRAGAVPAQLSRFAAVEFGQLVILAMWTLVVTGAILLFTRLSEPTATLPYGIVLGVKITLSAWMFFLTLNRRGRAREASDQGRLRSAVNALGHVNMTVVLGIIVFLISGILRMLVENELAG
jgi:putative copper export protein